MYLKETLFEYPNFWPLPLSKIDIKFLKKHDTLIDCLLNPNSLINECTPEKITQKLPYDDPQKADYFYSNLVCLHLGINCQLHPIWESWLPWSTCYPKNVEVPPVSQCPLIKGERFRTRKCDYFDVLDQGEEECEGRWLEFEVCDIKCEGGGVKVPKYLENCDTVR